MRDHRSLKELSALLGVTPFTVGRKVNEVMRVIAILMEDDTPLTMRMIADAVMDLRAQRAMDSAEIAARESMLNGRYSPASTANSGARPTVRR